MLGLSWAKLSSSWLDLNFLHCSDEQEYYLLYWLPPTSTCQVTKTFILLSSTPNPINCSFHTPATLKHPPVVNLLYVTQHYFFLNWKDIYTKRFPQPDILKGWERYWKGQKEVCFFLFRMGSEISFQFRKIGKFRPTPRFSELSTGKEMLHLIILCWFCPQ